METINIPGFMSLCLKYGCLKGVLDYATLVIDGDNFLYKTFIDNFPYNIFGTDYDKYAKYLREYLGNFKSCHIKFKFLFEGGYEVITDDKLKKINQFSNTTPIFLKEVYMQVLDELEIDYVVCEYESKNVAITLANSLNCLKVSVVSDDQRFCFSPISYIPYDTIKFNTHGYVEGQVFILNRFMRELDIEIGHVAIFIVIFKFFELIIFQAFFNYIHAYNNLERVLQWLSKHSVERAREILFTFIDIPTRCMFRQYEQEALDLISNNISQSAALKYLENRNTFMVSTEDHEWFTKGVCLNRVPTQYINLYRSKVMFCSLVMEDIHQQDAVLISRHIIRYAYDLLTNFNGSTFNILIRNNAKVEVGTEYSIDKPNGCEDGSESVFSRGWGSQPELFEHFLRTHLRMDYDKLSALSDDVQLVAVAAAYFAHARGAASRPQMYAVFACFAALRSTLLPNNTLTHDIDMSLLHSLVQFQHCLQQLNFLNVLCGSCLPPTKYADCYNTRLVYSLTLQAACAPDPSDYLRDLLIIPSASPDLKNRYDTLVDYFDDYNLYTST